MPSLTVDKPPSTPEHKRKPFTNCVYVSPGVFAALQAAAPAGASEVLVLISGCEGGEFVFAARAEAAVGDGRLWLSGEQRKMLRVELNQRVDAEVHDVGVGAVLGSLRLALDLVNKSKGPKAMDAGIIAGSVKRDFGGQAFALGQTLVLAVGGTYLNATVEGMDFASLGGSAGGARYGLLDKNATAVLPFAARHAKLEVVGEDPGARGDGGAPRQTLFTSDFDFAKLGIGGLGAEFDKIFRRAFASRIYPAHIIRQMGISHVRGMLLYGPPGCGKTLIARQIGKVLNAREPKIVNGPEVLDKYVGASEEKIRELFADAEAEQKAEGDDSMLHTIIFDEMDAICKSRGSVRDGTGVSDSIVNQLLSKIDGVDSLNNILVIGMTNRKDMIDEAILRPGRLELHVEIGLPDEAGRLQILDIKTASMRASGRLEKRAVDALPELAGRTKNFSGAELEGLVKSAASYALRRCVDVAGDNAIDEKSLRVSKGDFDHALDSGEAQAAFGAKAALLEPLYRNGIVDYGPQFRDLKRSLDRLVDQVRTSSRTPLMTVLLEGRGATGKTALAASTAVSAEFPFVRLLSADALIGRAAARAAPRGR